MQRLTNKEKIKQYFLKEVSEEGCEASEVAEALCMKRNAASAILNELTRERYLIKKKTKPVIFQRRTHKMTETSEENVFDEFSGTSDIMNQILNKCKISVTYPGRGLPIMLLGASGVGKSTLAEKIYLYARQKQMVEKKAPFVVLNCADYANNKELLSSVLFGYKKGAFTGAVKDTEGLFDKADQGYLFLDEVHRLPPEGQEKLFRYIDTGMITPIGNGAREKNLNVRLIFATTEDIDNLMLDTFIRRIPITVTIPSYHERSSNERMQIIYKLFLQEAEILNSCLKVSSNVLNRLLFFKSKGNIGSLKNIIKISCANAFHRKKNGEDCIEVALQDLPVQDMLQTAVGTKKECESPQWVFIDQNLQEMELISVDPVEENLCIDQMLEIAEEFVVGDCTYEEFVKKNKQLVDKIMDNLVYQVEVLAVETVYNEYVENILKFMQNNYGIEFHGTEVKILTKLLALLNSSSVFFKEDKKKRFRDVQLRLRKIIFRPAQMADVFYKMADQMLDYHINTDLFKLFLILFFQYQIGGDRPYYYGIIITHGYSTASSIASLVNQVYSQYIFDAFDMPYHTSIKQIEERVRSYLKRIDTSAGVLILADMGSILNISEKIEDMVEGNLGIINNVTTQMALEAGHNIMQKRDMEVILKTIVKYNSTTYRFVRQKEKQTAILVCCMKGLEVADKICELLRGCLEDHRIKILEYDYEKIIRNGIEDEIFDFYNIDLIISTNSINNVENVRVLPFNELIDQVGYETLKQVLSNFYSEEEIKDIIERIIKSFSLRNIVSQLTILNPEIIINDVEDVIRKMELELKIPFAPDLKQLLYMHIGIMIERLMKERHQDKNNQFVEFAKKHEEFCDMSEKCFSVIEKRYHVTVNIREIRLIYNIISSKIKINL